jgi:hypothetical protein
MYWQLLDRIDVLTPADHVIIMWPQNHRLINWYDAEWIVHNRCKDFFPKTDGELWFTETTPYLGMYRTHPDHMTSLSHMIISGFDVILQTQLLLNKIGCKYTMTYAQNPWLDGRPTYSPIFTTQWNNKNQISLKEKATVNSLLELRPVKNLLNQIDWSMFIDTPTNKNDPTQYLGIWEYYMSKKEFILYKHDTDNHPCSLAHHDWAVEKLLHINPANAKHRILSQKISHLAMTMPVGEFTNQDYIADITTSALNPEFEKMLRDII